MLIQHPIGSVLVHLDGTVRAELRWRLGMQIARNFDAHLSAIFAVAPRYLPLVAIGGVPSMLPPPAIDPEHRQRALDILRRSSAPGRERGEWLEPGDDSVVRGVVRRAMTADLVVLGQRDCRDAEAFDVPADLVSSVVIESGRPTLVVPAEGPVSARPESILVAWKPTPEAARALTAALPFLRDAREIHLTEDAIDEIDIAPVGARDYLRWHGIEQVRAARRLSRQDSGTDLLALANECGAQLIVLGCYGHSRARELVMGGVSRVLLEASPIPILTVH